MNINTDKAVDILIEITPYVADILNDEDIKKVIEKYRNTVTDRREIKYMTELIPVILKKYREAVYIILAAINGKKVEEIKTQSLSETIKQLKEIAKDEDLNSFFMSFARAD